MDGVRMNGHAGDLHGGAVPDVHMFWHGRGLSRVERLCMASFLAHGHAVHLYVYDETKDVPQGVTIEDASRVIERAEIFYHANTGSIAQFADWFRYRVLLASGGLWADTDVVCLAPIKSSRSEVFAWQDADSINNAVLGLTRGHLLSKWMAEGCEHPNRFLPYDNFRSKRRKFWRQLRGNRRGDVKWGEYGPAGLTQAIRHFGYTDAALPASAFYAVPFEQWRTVFEGGIADWDARLSGSVALHLWNEMMRSAPDFDKNAYFPEDSLFEKLCARYLKGDS